VPAAPDAEHFRDAAFQQQPCLCNNRHKFAQFCGAYAVRDQDAWMERDGEADQRLSLFTDAGALAAFGVRREGVCQPCLACPLEHFNGLCVSGRAGLCALCRTLASCTATPRPHLQHEHALGCAQTTALSDYECGKCPVWAKIWQAHVLLVWCGNENLRRWTPTARAFDSVLVVAECLFEHTPGAAGERRVHALRPGAAAPAALRQLQRAAAVLPPRLVLQVRGPPVVGAVGPRVLRQVRGVPAREGQEHCDVACVLRRERLRLAVEQLRRPLQEQHVRGQQHLPLLHDVQGGRAVTRRAFLLLLTLLFGICLFCAWVWILHGFPIMEICPEGFF